MTVSKITLAVAMAASALVAAPAFAQDAPADGFTVTGTVGGVSDYRFRGISQTGEDFAVQGSINVNHESGFYVGAWASNVKFANSSELDVYAGYTRDFGGITGDVGVYWYLFPGTNGTDVGEVYASLKGQVGPATLKVGANYAPKQEAIGFQNRKDDNLYVYGDVSTAIPTTPISLRGHLGYSAGDSTLTIGGDNYFDYSVGADLNWKNLTFGVTYLDTDLKKSRYGLYHDQVDSTVLFSVTAAF